MRVTSVRESTQASSECIAEGESLESDADEDDVKKITQQLKDFSSQGEHHICGVKGAKLRFSTLAQS